MRPTPVRLPDDVLAPACQTLGIEGSPDEALLNPAVRAAVQAAVRAQILPRPLRRRIHQTQLTAARLQTTLGFDREGVDIKRRAANDKDED